MAQYAVFIGRFQPVHIGHVGVVKRALDSHERVIICVGSANRGSRTDNPFTFNQRVRLWEHELTDEELERVQFVKIDDALYKDNEWVAQVRHRVSRAIQATHGLDYSPTVALVGHEKDHTSYYLRFFPEWESDLMPKGYDSLASTTIRNFFYEKLRMYAVSPDMFYGVEELRGLSTTSPIWSAEYLSVLRDLAGEWDFDRNYDPKRFHVNVLTVDAVVVQNGHLLVVRRKNRPGQGLLALPGGHIDPNETLKQAALRELREETSIDLSDRVLKANIQDQQIFDHPDRSRRARVITTAFLIKLPDEEKLVKVKGGDDAAEAFWMPLSEVRYEDFFEDHAAVIEFMTATL